MADIAPISFFVSVLAGVGKEADRLRDTAPASEVVRQKRS